MTDPSPLDPLRGLPPELAGLDAELSWIRIEERASFGPELEAELRREFADSAPSEARGGRRTLLAACIALLLIAGTVPPARASLVALIERLQRARPAAAAPAPAPAPAAREARDESVPSSLSRAPERPPSEAAPPARMIPPRVLNVEDERAAIRRVYPPGLLARGIGGIVNVLLWVDSVGGVDHAEVYESSGHPELDRAAMQVAPRLRFRPATRDGSPVGTWVRFDLLFEPVHDRLPTVRPVDPPQLPADTSLEASPAWTGYTPIPAPTLRETRELLQVALPDAAVGAQLGSLDGLVQGEPPPGADPLSWRTLAVDALEAAILRAPDNPAPFLALARILRKQGLHQEARELLERGIERAEWEEGRVSPRLTAELHYELATAAREGWSARALLGELPATALDDGSCVRARGGATSDPVAPEVLIAWNYLCPDELSRILALRFEPVAEAGRDRVAMRRSLYAAVAADPGHVGANLELLLDLGDDGDPRAMLSGARRFAYASIGHPYARLLSGIALERISRSEDALAELEAGLAGLAPEDAERIRDPSPLLDSLPAEHFAGLRGEVRVRAEASFWRALDPLLSTEVNERLVAHLARSAYAHLRLGGSHTDAGEVWVRYGEPLSIRAVGAGTEQRTELWDYGGGPAVTFRKLATSSMRDLTSEARAYLEDLRATRPHSYGTGGREMSALTAAVSRFRGPSGATELEVATRVPEPLISGTDTVEFVLIQLDGNGERVASRRRRVELGATLRARFGVHERGSELAVEIYNPILARGATLRVPVGRDAGGVGPTASDLQLVAAVARPEREVVRGASWILPLSDRRLDAPEVGVLFELYDLPGAGPYRLRLELVWVAGGAARPVEFRPAGHARFGWSFARAPWPGPARSTEYVTMRLEGVSSGNYLLRAIAELPDGRAIVSERRVERK